MNTLTFLLFAITLNANTGEEIERHRAPDTPAWEHVEDCSRAQAATGTQHVTPGAPPTITVYSCVAIKGDVTT